MRNFLGLAQCPDPAQRTDIYRVSRPCLRKSLSLPSSSRPLPRVSLRESCLFCGNKHILVPFWLSMAGGKAKWSPVLLHESSLRSASRILAEAPCFRRMGCRVGRKCVESQIPGRLQLRLETQSFDRKTDHI